MNRLFKKKVAEVCLSAMALTAVLPAAVSHAGVFVPNGSLKYDSVSQRVYGTVYSDQPYVSVVAGAYEGSVPYDTYSKSFTATRAVYGVNNISVNQFDIDTVLDSTYYSITITDPSNDLSSNVVLNKYMVAYPNLYTFDTRWWAPSGVFKDISFGITDVVYKSLTNYPKVVSINPQAVWGDPFSPLESKTTSLSSMNNCSIISSNPQVAEIYNRDYLMLHQEGNITLTAVCGNFSKSKSIQVKPGRYEQISFYVNNDVAVGQSVYYSMSGRDSDYNWSSINNGVTFSTSNPDIISVDPASKQITGKKPGYTVLTATYGELSNQTPIYVYDRYISNLSSVALATYTEQQAYQGLVVGNVFKPQVYALYWSSWSGGYTVEPVTNQATFQFADVSFGQFNADGSVVVKKPGATQLIAIFGHRYVKIPVNIWPY